MKKRGFLFAAMLAAGLLGFLVSCRFDAEVSEKKEAPVSSVPELTRRENLALMKALPSHTVDGDQLQTIVQGFVGNYTGSRNAAGTLALGSAEKFDLGTERRFAKYTGGRSAEDVPEETPVELWTFPLENPAEDKTGYVLASNDERIGFVLAIIEEGAPEDSETPFDEFFNLKLDDYIEGVIAGYDSISEEEIEQAYEKLESLEPERYLTTRWFKDPNYIPTGYYTTDFRVTVAPLIKTKWNQTKPYNFYASYRETLKPEKRYWEIVTGCVPTAMAQLVAYYGYITTFNKPPNFDLSVLTSGGKNYRGIWNGTYNFNTLRNTVKFSEYDNAVLLGQVQALMYQIGLGVKANYQDGKKGTAASNNNASWWFLTNGYQATTDTFFDATEMTSETSSSFSLKYYNNSNNRVKDALNRNRPVLISGYSNGSDGKKGHMWLIDGWGPVSYYAEYYDSSNGQYTMGISWYFNNCMMVHCNLGWGGQSDGWYLYGIFDTTNVSLIPDNGRAAGSKGDYDFTNNVLIFCPYR